MAKNIVKVNEEEIRGYMVGNIPDAIEKEDVIVVEVPAEETAPEVSIASYISNIIAEHIELNIEEITRMYKDRFSPPKIQ